MRHRVRFIYRSKLHEDQSGIRCPSTCSLGRQQSYHQAERLKDKLGIDVMEQLKAAVLKTHERQNNARMELTPRALRMESNVGALLSATIAVTAFGAGGDAPGDVDDVVILTMLSQRPIMFQGSQVESQDRVGALTTAIDDAVGHGLPPESAKILRDIGFSAHLDVVRRALLGDPHARDQTCRGGLLSRSVTRPGDPVCVHVSVKYAQVLFAGSEFFRERRLWVVCRRTLRGADPH